MRQEWGGVWREPVKIKERSFLHRRTEVGKLGFLPHVKNGKPETVPAG